MIINNFTLLQAEAISEQYQYLVNKPIELNKHWLIDCIAVAPSDSLNQWIFAHFYLDTRCPIAAGTFYTGQDYSVIAISICNEQSGELIFKDISIYLREQGNSGLASTCEVEKLSGPTRIISIEAYQPKYY